MTNLGRCVIGCIRLLIMRVFMGGLVNKYVVEKMGRPLLRVCEVGGENSLRYFSLEIELVLKRTNRFVVLKRTNRFVDVIIRAKCVDVFPLWRI